MRSSQLRLRSPQGVAELATFWVATTDLNELSNIDAELRELCRAAPSCCQMGGEAGRARSATWPRGGGLTPSASRSCRLASGLQELL